MNLNEKPKLTLKSNSHRMVVLGCLHSFFPFSWLFWKEVETPRPSLHAQPAVVGSLTTNNPDL